MDDKNPIKKSKTTFTYSIIFLGASMLLLASLTAFFQLKSSYTSYIKEGRENTVQLTNAVSGYIDLSFLTVDLILHRASDKQYVNSLFGNHLHADMASHFRTWINDVPAIRGMIVTDERGTVKQVFYKENDTEIPFKEGSTIRDQRYFITHKMDEENEVQISPMTSGVANGKDFVILSRSITKLNGSFGGVIAALIDVNSLTGILRSVEINKHTRMMLMLDDGAILAQTPTKETQGDFNTGRFISSLLGRYQEQKMEINVIEEQIDDKNYIISLKHLSHLPITLSLFVDEHTVLADWRTSRNNYALFVGIFALFIALISFLAVVIEKQVRQIRRSEQNALLSNKNTSKFITKMNYELRTPLNTIIGFSEMIHLGYFGSLNDKQKERIYDIHICGTMLLEFIYDILEIIKGEEGQLALSESKVEIFAVLEAAMRTVSPYAKKEGVNITYEEGIDTLPSIRADERKLRQALLNLINNIIKYTPSGGMIAIAGEMDIKNNMVVNVTSKGITISPEDFSQAFSLSGQLNNTDNETGGLGLPLCKIFVECHGGRIKLHHVGGEGITVRVILPAERVMDSLHE